jgi:two-component system, OmpR family, phosphate regulon sensor histidine kinase PhoR
MRGLIAQFLLPVILVLGGIFAGLLAGSLAWGIVIGGLLAMLVALLLARRAVRQLQLLEQLVRQGSEVDIDSIATIDPHDQVGHALRTVAQSAIDEQQRRRNATLLLTQLTQVLDRMNDGLMRVAMDGRVIYANVAAGSLFGGRNPTGRTFMSATRDHELNRAVRRCLETGEEQQHTLEIPGDGRLVNAVIVLLSERPIEALVMLRDITEVNRLQNLRREFVSNVSHELRTPLSTIKILTETLLDIREDDDEAGQFLRKIDQEVDSMTALVRDLLDLTRLESTSSRLVLRAFDAALLVDDIRDRMRPLAARHDVELMTTVEDGLEALVGDERRLHQALINLVTNAVVHTAAGGTVTIGAVRDVGGVRFFVRDTGVGIPEDDLPRVWERFFKADKARTGPGTGLGLAIVKHIVQAHSGTVSATSVLGKGSEFWFVIPRDLGPVPTPPPVYETQIAPN